MTFVVPYLVSLPAINHQFSPNVLTDAEKKRPTSRSTEVLTQESVPTS